MILDEPDASLVIAATERWSASGTRILVPGHFWLEITHPLLRRYRWTSHQMLAGLRDIDALQPQTIPIDRPILLLAMDLAERHRLSMYDATSAALAQVTGGTLATFDLALRQAFPELLEPGFGEIPPRRVNDARAAYGDDRPVAGVDWSEIGSYLGVLRRRAREELDPPARR